MRQEEMTTDESWRICLEDGRPGQALRVYDKSEEGLPGSYAPWHWHKEVELLWVWEGALAVETEAASFCLGVGQGAFLNSGVLHRVRCSPDWGGKMTVVSFEPRSFFDGDDQFLLRGPMPVAIALTGEAIWHQEVLAGIRQVSAWCRSVSYKRERIVRRELTTVWRRLLMEEPSADEQTKKKKQDQWVKLMVRFLQEHMAEPLQTKDVADAVGMSPRRCSYYFQQRLGISPAAYLTQLRIWTAAAMLEQTNMPISQIGPAVGFSSGTCFKKMFCDHTGMNPREFRKERKPNTKSVC